MAPTDNVRPDMGGARGRSFSDAQNARMRAAAVRLRERYGSITALADKLGVTQPTVSNFLSGKNGAGPELALKLAKLTGRTLTELLEGEIGDAPATPVAAALRGWEEAESQARAFLRHTPEWVFTCARNLSGINLPDVADVELVVKLVGFVQQFPPPGAAETPAAPTAETAEALSEVERVKARAEIRMGKKPKK